MTSGAEHEMYERITVGRLAEMLDLDKSTVSRKVDALVDEGLVVKTRDGSDGRIVILELSPAMDELYDRYDEPYAQAIHRIRALRILTEEISR